MTTTTDNTMPPPGAKWAFDHAVTAVFDDMLARSIPQYDEMRRLVFDLGSRFVQTGTDVLDLGCSRGAALAPFVDRFGADVRCVGLDESPPMVDACRGRFRHEIRAGLVDVRNHDLRKALPPLMPSLTLAILTLQFVPIEYRQRVVADVFNRTRPGGAMVVVEKTLGPDAATDRLFVDTYYTLKGANGYTAEQVAAKRKSLEGVLVPLTPEGNESMLRAEGFRVSRFWTWCNFAGWLAVKPRGA
jgi:tRNA (cmo5U34)-methyltransferase